jgi:octaprenyl-diphosphate synthase
MPGIDQIKKPIAADIEVFEEKFKDSMHSDAPLLDRITHYIVKRKGKQIRPMFVFLLLNFAEGSLNLHTVVRHW